MRCNGAFLTQLKCFIQLRSSLKMSVYAQQGISNDTFQRVLLLLLYVEKLENHFNGKLSFNNRLQSLQSQFYFSNLRLNEPQIL
jgi:hypothetical protein